MGDLQKMQPRPFKTIFFNRFSTFPTADRENKVDAASRQLPLMSFKGIGKSIRKIEAPTHKADAPAHLADEFPAGYSLTSCSPALLVSASPAVDRSAAGLAQLRGTLNKKRTGLL